MKTHVQKTLSSCGAGREAGHGNGEGAPVKLTARERRAACSGSLTSHRSSMSWKISTGLPSARQVAVLSWSRCENCEQDEITGCQRHGSTCAGSNKKKVACCHRERNKGTTITTALHPQGFQSYRKECHGSWQNLVVPCRPAEHMQAWRYHLDASESRPDDKRCHITLQFRSLWHIQTQPYAS